MAARRNRRRKHAPRPKLKLPVVNWHRVVAATTAMAVIAAVYVSTVWLMNRPVQAVVIKGPFERVSALELQEVLSDYVNTGFLTADLNQIRNKATTIPWIASATVSRQWPGTIEVTVTEQIPAACWGDSGLVNTEGELFVAQSSHVPAELPRLSGPPGTEKQVAARFFEIETRLEQRGLAAVSLKLDARGAWSFDLNNGMQVRLGAQQVEQRLDRFFLALDRLLSARADQVAYVDMRYTNGFAIGWKGSRSVRRERTGETDPNV
ncbi:MAG TPA: FtsQ-type POTRA domain-containing protein [Chromatiales bacterium]|nr:FtsQ-type POTRA domain-containing protein [Chromatiales bacterium]